MSEVQNKLNELQEHKDEQVRLEEEKIRQIEEDKLLSKQQEVERNE